jgi:hypothetical protein
MVFDLDACKGFSLGIISYSLMITVQAISGSALNLAI